MPTFGKDLARTRLHEVRNSGGFFERLDVQVSSDDGKTWGTLPTTVSDERPEIIKHMPGNIHEVRTTMLISEKELHRDGT